MKGRTLRWLLLLALVVLTLVPATAAFADDGDSGNYKFYGTVVSFPANYVGDWQVNDGTVNRTVHVTAATRINTEHGPITQGVCVEVKGWLQTDNSVNATKIETKDPSKCSGSGGGEEGHNYIEFYGTVSALPSTQGWVGDWTVSGRTVHVTQTTRIEEHHGPVAVGACVQVKGMLQPDTSVNAIQIETEDPWKCPGSGGGSGGNSGYTEFYGTVQQLPANGLIGDWTVSGRTVHVDASTRINQEHGPVAVGAYVEVKGWLQSDGSVNATKVEVKLSAGSGSGGRNYIKFYGTIDSLPTGTWIGDWGVGGRTVHVSASTRIDQEHGPVAVGAYVEVKGWTRADNSVDAVKIEVKVGPSAGNGGSSGTYTKFYGFVEQLPSNGLVGPWIISGRVVTVTATTWINQEHGAVAVNAYVEVEGLLQANGNVEATKIEVKASPPTGGQSMPLIKFYGTVENLPASSLVGTWTVSGRTVYVDANTWINQEHGAVAVNAYVEVEGYLQSDGSINATKIEVKDSPNSGSGGGNSTVYVKLYGVVEDLPATGLIGDWLVSGRTVHVDANTRIEQEHGPVQIGVNVEVKGIQQADGSVNALKIEVKR